MYHKLLDRLITYHNDVTLYPQFSSLINHYQNSKTDNKATQALIIDIENVMVFEIEITQLYDDVIMFENWLKILENYDHYDYIDNYQCSSWCQVLTCLYCCKRGSTCYINDDITLCSGCFRNLKTSKSGKFGKLETKFPVSLDLWAPIDSNDYQKIYYNIDDTSLNLWRKDNESCYHFRLTFSKQLSSLKYNECSVFYDEDLSADICNTCEQRHSLTHFDYGMIECNQCTKILICRNDMIAKLINRKLIAFVGCDIITDIKSKIIELLIIIAIF